MARIFGVRSQPIGQRKGDKKVVGVEHEPINSFQKTQLHTVAANRTKTTLTGVAEISHIMTRWVLTLARTYT